MSEVMNVGVMNVGQSILLDLVLLSIVHLVSRVGIQGSSASTKAITLGSVQPPVAGLNKKIIVPCIRTLLKSVG